LQLNFIAIEVIMCRFSFDHPLLIDPNGWLFSYKDRILLVKLCWRSSQFSFSLWGRPGSVGILCRILSIHLGYYSTYQIKSCHKSTNNDCKFNYK
jgi:hypothetical protein